MADIPEIPNCSASPDHGDVLATIQNAADDWQAQGYPTALAEVRDMANVGRALMTAIADNAGSPPLMGWHPADCPSEIVSDLLNMLDDATRAAPPAMDREAVIDIIGRIRKQADCLEGYAESHGFSGKAPASVFHWQATHFRDLAAEMERALSTLPADAIRQGDKDWVPQIGERVAISPLSPYEADWRHMDLWCCGVRVHDSGDGLDITVTEQWPMPSRHSREYMGPTDGFRLNASGFADDITRLATPASHASDGGKA